MKTIAHQENSVLGICQLQDPVEEKMMMIGVVESHPPPTENLPPGLITTRKLLCQHQHIRRIHGIIRKMVKITANLQGVPIMIK